MPIQRAKNISEYYSNYQYSISNPLEFWGNEAKRLDWFKDFTKVKSSSFDLKDHHVRWFEDGVLNVCYNCVDRHLPTRGDKLAIIWQGDDPNSSQKITYSQLHKQVCKFANVLKSLGVVKGDRVIIYLPMIPEAAVAMLACARIGAVHSVVFGGFSSEALANRIEDCKPKVLITVNEAKRGGKSIPFKKNVDDALVHVSVEKSIIIKHNNTQIAQSSASSLTRTEGAEIGDLVSETLEIPGRASLARDDVKNAVNWIEGRDVDYHQLISEASDVCEAEAMSAEDPLFILYTSGSTGKPKGVLHTSAGYLLYASMTHEHIFNLEENDVYWCTADVGWITGHSYVVYGPLANGATNLMFEGIPTWPDESRYWQIIEKYKVSIFYTSPTALRSLIRFGDELVLKRDLSSLKMLGSVGEPIDPTTWKWFYEIVGKAKCPIADTWWQTETGGIMIAPLPITNPKPGSATLPFYGIMPELLENNALAIKDSWPGMMRDLFNNHQRFLDSYFREYPGFYCCGDGAYKDEDGYYWITGRMDDVLKVSGHRIGSAEIEATLDKLPQIAESAAVGYPHDVKGEGIYVYAVLKNGFKPSLELEKELIAAVRNAIGAIANIDKIQWADQLPKTRSGKVMRRILRKIAAGEIDNFGDISTLMDPMVVDDLILVRK
jgi:acetyl-CoA synthetase